MCNVGQEGAKGGLRRDECLKVGQFDDNMY